MCGIVGMFNKGSRTADPALLRRMADRIAYRGPDEEDGLTDGPLGLYHKRLAVLDLKTGRQPMTAEGVSVVFNGEIYNYRDIRRELAGRGRQFETTSDTEVLLKAYLEFGPDCVKRFNGMFAFVLYDRPRKRLMAARDHFGLKPLYFFEGGEGWFFASEIKALLAHPSIPAEANVPSIREYTVFQYVLDEETFFRGVRKVCPGHYYLIDTESGDCRAERFWDLDFTVDTHHTREYFLEKLRDLLEDAIRLQLHCDVAVGTTLSGGVDSSLVTLLAARYSPSVLTCFTGAFREAPGFDETPYARQVAEKAGAVFREITPTAVDFIETISDLVFHMDEPAAGPGLFPQYMVAREAARHVKVVLGGQGGDEIFGGYARYTVAYLEQALKGAITETNDEGEHIVSLKSILPNLPVLREYTPLLGRFWQTGLFEPMAGRYFRLLDRSGSNRSMFSADFREGFDDELIFKRFLDVFDHPQTLSYYNKMVHFDLKTNLPALLHVEDRMSMACGLESRCPLLDRRIAELVASIPPKMKFHGGELKHILKTAASDILPPAVLRRKDKMGFPVPLHLWVRNGLKNFVRDTLLSKACRERGLFDPAAVEKLIDREEAYGRTLWGLLNIELWFRLFIDGTGEGRS
ncbi:MAG: asparagine synthase (glutamine-hydrolyzing) [Candidatus Aminicenantes bacterium]|nr:asparagine synthase (glutamine-hydrolyzing) [Candidatus Aminicenantes bacterium]